MANPALASAAPSAPPRPTRPRRASTRTAPRRASTRTTPRRRPTSAQAKSRPRPQARSRPRPKRPVSARRIVQPAFAGAAAGAAMLPGAALRSAVAVRDLSDSSLIFRLTRGRGWIAVLSVLLFGIVALNVISLSLNAGSGRVSQAVEALERQNSGLRAQLAEQLSASRIQGTAAVQGLAVPPPEAISYLSAEDGDLERLVKLLEQDTLLTREPAEVISSASEPVAYQPPVTAAPSPTPSPAPAPTPTPVAPDSATPPPASSDGSTGSTGSGGVGL